MNGWLKRPNWQLAIISGTLVGLSYPLFPLGFLAWFGFIPLIHVLTRTNPRTAFRMGYLAGAVANLVSLYWIGFNSGAGFLTVFASLIGAVLYLGIFWGFFALAVSLVHKYLRFGLLIWPFFWVLMEYIRSFGAMGFPWINLALTQVSYLPMVQLAEITGTYGIAFWIISLNLGFYRLIVNKNYRVQLLGGLAGIVLLIYLSGQLRINYYENRSADRYFSIALVQPNLNPNDKWEKSKREFVFNLMDCYMRSLSLFFNPRKRLKLALSTIWYSNWSSERL